VLQGRFQQLRDAKAQSMIDELIKTVHLAKADLAESTARLAATEKQVGSDLAELRVLHDATSGDSALRQTLTEIRNELRLIRTTRKSNQQLLALLKEGRGDPGRLIAMPNRLLQSQPALRRLKDGLVDAQLRTAELRGTMSEVHPLAHSARQTEEEIGRRLHNELAIAIRSLEVELRMNSDREAILEAQLAKVAERLGRLAELRATYSNQVAETDNRIQLAAAAEENLAEARAAHASAKATSLISRIDTPDAGTHPIGPGRAMILLAGVGGGLLIGFGVVFLTVQPIQPHAQGAGGADGPTSSLADVRPVTQPTEPVLDPAGSLSFKQALQKITYGSKV